MTGGQECEQTAGLKKEKNCCCLCGIKKRFVKKSEESSGFEIHLASKRKGTRVEEPEKSPKN